MFFAITHTESRCVHLSTAGGPPWVRWYLCERIFRAHKCDTTWWGRHKDKASGCWWVVGDCQQRDITIESIARILPSDMSHTEWSHMSFLSHALTSKTYGSLTYYICFSYLFPINGIPPLCYCCCVARGLTQTNHWRATCAIGRSTVIGSWPPISRRSDISGE